MAKDKIEYHDTCPKCKKQMTKVNGTKHLVYLCKNCKQKYRIDVVHPSQEVICPHCNEVVRLDRETTSNLHFNSVFRFYTRKVKI